MRITTRDKYLLRRLKGRNQSTRENCEWAVALSPPERESAVKLTKMGFLAKERLPTGHVVIWLQTHD